MSLARSDVRPQNGGWTPTAYSKALKKNRSTRDTAPELLLRKALHRLGIRFRLHQPIGQRLTADIILPRYRLAVFIDGCFWHSCPEHGRAIKTGPNSSLWKAKMESIKERERRAARLLNEAGYRVMRLWECAILHDAANVALLVQRATQGPLPVVKPARGPIKRRCRKPSPNRRGGRWL